MTREAIYAALETQLRSNISAALVPTISRLREQPSDNATPVLEYPCVYIQQLGEDPKPDPDNPMLLIFECELDIYVDAQDLNDVVRSSRLNPVLDAVDAALQPDPITGRLTLGGLVYNCKRLGKSPTIEGVMQQKATAVWPIQITVGRDNSGAAQQFSFGAGAVWALPVAGAPNQSLADVLTPIRVGRIKGVDAGLDFNPELAWGGYGIALTANATRHDITGTIKSGTFSGDALTRLVLGVNPSTGGRYVAVDVVGTVPAAAAYTVTPTVPAGGAWSSDLGVLLADGTPLIRVSGSPAAGQYSVSAGVYTFNAAQASKAVAVSFLYTISTGKSFAWGNLLQGVMPSFRMIFQTDYNGKLICWDLYNVMIPKLQFPTAVEEFTLYNLGFRAVADSSNNIGMISAG